MAFELFRHETLNYRLGIALAAYPLAYVKTLIQLGYEPIPPTLALNSLGERVLHFPGAFQYINYIRNRDGLFGLFNGFGPKLCETILSYIVYEKVSKAVRLDGTDSREAEDNQEDDDSANSVRFVRSLIRHTLAQTVSIVLSQPFRVIAIRTMAHFIKEEAKNARAMNSVMQIYTECGFSGFFRGLAPRIIGELLSIFIGSILSYTINNSMTKYPKCQPLITHFARYIASSVAYPYSVVSTCMGNLTELEEAVPTQMAQCMNWIDYWDHLARRDQLQRGARLFWRSSKMWQLS